MKRHTEVPPPGSDERLGGSIEIKRIGKTFGVGSARQVTALRDISFDVQGSEFVSILGASGCGKSTLLGIIAGYIQPTEGSVFVDDQLVNTTHPDRTVVFQEFALFPWMTARQNVACALKARSVPRRDWDARTAELLNLVNLLDFANQYPYQLSGGMKQRLAIARALAAEPKIILMDEPFAALDSQTRDVMQEEILRIWDGERKRTIMLVTHSIEEAVFLSDRILLLSSRPGTVKDIVSVKLSRPRDPAVRRTREFQELVGYLWSGLRPEVVV